MHSFGIIHRDMKLENVTLSCVLEVPLLGFCPGAARWPRLIWRTLPFTGVPEGGMPKPSELHDASRRALSDKSGLGKCKFISSAGRGEDNRLRSFQEHAAGRHWQVPGML